MAFEEVELHETSISTKADIGKGRSAVTIGIDTPLRSEAAAALGCREMLFTNGGEVRPDLFFSTSVFHLSAEAVTVHLELDGIAKRKITAPDAEAGPVTIELAEGGIRLKVRLVGSGIPTHAASSAGIRDGGWQRAAHLPHFGEGLSKRFWREF